MLKYLLYFSLLFAQKAFTQSPPATACASYGYEPYHAFRKIMNDPKYRCYGTPCASYESYKCPKYGQTCSGTYISQSFCKGGKVTKLYYTASECTCGCADKNFHGKKLNILNLEPCGCEIIGADY
jgi:hypothetical protein